MIEHNLAAAIVAAIAAVATSIVAPVVTFWLKSRQDKEIEARLAWKVDNIQITADYVAQAAKLTANLAEEKLDNIQNAVNGRLSEALSKIVELEALLADVVSQAPKRGGGKL